MAQFLYGSMVFATTEEIRGKLGVGRIRAELSCVINRVSNLADSGHK